MLIMSRRQRGVWREMMSNELWRVAEQRRIEGSKICPSDATNEKSTAT